MKEMLQRITGTPFNPISLLKDGRILQDSSYYYENNSTLMANMKAARAMTHLEQLEQDELQNTLYSAFDSRSTTLGDASLGSLQRREIAKQKLYTSYLRARGVLHV